LRERRKVPERRRHHAAEPAGQRVEVVLEEFVERRIGVASDIRLHHVGDFLIELGPVRMRGIASVGANQLPDTSSVGIDVVELVNDRVELRQPSWSVGRIEISFAGTVERLITKSRQHERDQVLDPRSGDPHIR
jgi:hypothetical protein